MNTDAQTAALRLVFARRVCAALGVKSTETVWQTHATLERHADPIAFRAG